jgi:hypothetical protein
MFFLGGRGRGRGDPGWVLLRSFHSTSGIQTVLFVLYSICWAVEVSLQHVFRQSRKGVPRSSNALGRRVRCFQDSTSRRPVHTLTTLEGILPSFQHGLHGTVGMIFYAHVVYVVICYMSIICYMPVICLLQSPPQEVVPMFSYIEGPFLVRRTGCTCERHAPCIDGPFLVNKSGHACQRHTP